MKNLQYKLYRPVEKLPSLLISDGVLKLWEKNQDASELIAGITLLHLNPSMVPKQFNLKEVQRWKLEVSDKKPILKGTWQNSGCVQIIPLHDEYSGAQEFEVFCRSLEISGRTCQVFFTEIEHKKSRRNKGFG